MSQGAAAVGLWAGGEHTCALTNSGALLCWGNNWTGQLGDGSEWSAGGPTPEPVVGLDAAVVAVSAGGSHTCAITADHSIWCWGDNTHGQLGDGSNANAWVPTPVAAWQGTATKLDAADAHTCAINDDESLWCWGAYYVFDPSSDDNSIESLTPTRIESLGTGVTDVAAGAYHTCVLKADGTIWCWGNNTYGQVGAGSGVPRRPDEPVQVTGIPDAPKQLSAGALHTCALLDDRSIWCWGGNAQGQLGRGSLADAGEPAPVAWPATAAPPDEVDCGGAHTCAKTADGRVWCWGSNADHSLGTGSAEPMAAGGQPSPVALCSLCSASSVATGEAHRCALSEAGGVSCWGDNEFGQTGITGPSTEPIPLPVNLGDELP